MIDLFHILSERTRISHSFRINVKAQKLQRDMPEVISGSLVSPLLFQRVHLRVTGMFYNLFIPNYFNIDHYIKNEKSFRDLVFEGKMFQTKMPERGGKVIKSVRLVFANFVIDIIDKHDI